MSQENISSIESGGSLAELQKLKEGGDLTTPYIQMKQGSVLASEADSVSNLNIPNRIKSVKSVSSKRSLNPQRRISWRNDTDYYN